jgi:murein L,D-transpeptidase YafK
VNDRSKSVALASDRHGSTVRPVRPFVLLVVLSLSAWGDRVTEARTRRAADLKALADHAGLTLPVDEVYLRVFKHERQVELWATSTRHGAMSLIKTYDICAASGELGPKRKEGDLQVPEGLYEVPEFNPTSSYHLALKVSYPNASDRVRSDPQTPGGLIYMHGKCASIGCIAIEDEPIEEVYLFALDSKRKPVRLDVFPRRLTRAELADPSPWRSFWLELLPALEVFEQTHRPPPFTVDRKTGAYVVKTTAKN